MISKLFIQKLHYDCEGVYAGELFLCKMFALLVIDSNDYICVPQMLLILAWVDTHGAT